MRAHVGVPAPSSVCCSPALTLWHVFGGGGRRSSQPPTPTRPRRRRRCGDDGNGLVHAQEQGAHGCLVCLVCATALVVRRARCANRGKPARSPPRPPHARRRRRRQQQLLTPHSRPRLQLLRPRPLLLHKQAQLLRRRQPRQLLRLRQPRKLLRRKHSLPPQRRARRNAPPPQPQGCRGMRAEQRGPLAALMSRGGPQSPRRPLGLAPSEAGPA